MKWIYRVLSWAVAVLVMAAILNPLLPKYQPKLEVVYLRLVEPFASFIDRKVDLLATWPVALILLSFLVFSSQEMRKWFPTVFRRVRGVSAFGVNLELDQQFKAVQKEGEDLEELLPRLRLSVTERVAQNVADARISESFSDLLKVVVEKLEQDQPQLDKKSIRATVHVPDPIFEDQLMQLLEYQDGNGKILPGKRSGRSFSIRRGIVGRCWRSHLPEFASVLTKDQLMGDPEQKQKMIAQTWGLTLDEAILAEAYPSYICIPFKSGEFQSVFYMDSKKDEAFGEVQNQEIEQLFFQQVDTSGLASAIGQLIGSLPGRQLQTEYRK